MPGASVRKRAGPRAEEPLAQLRGFGRVLDKLNDLAFGNSANLIQVQAAFAFCFIGVDRGAKKGVGDHSDGGDCRGSHAEQKLPVLEESVQRTGPFESSKLGGAEQA